MWDAKTEPGVVEIFEQIWGTDKLTVSFGKSIDLSPAAIANGPDGGNFSVPLPKEQLEDGGAPWPHMDQSPLKPQLASIQGILNLLPNGPKDGGLTVVTGSTKYFKEIWDYFKDTNVSGPCSKVPRRLLTCRAHTTLTIISNATMSRWHGSQRGGAISKSRASSQETLSSGTRGQSTGELLPKSRTTEWQSVSSFLLCVQDLR
jgi:hypothetical protein